MIDPYPSDNIPRAILLLALEVLELAPAATASTSPLDKQKFRRRANFAAITLREAMPADAFDFDATIVPLAANDPARGGLDADL
jgi:hypothetical protein